MIKAEYTMKLGTEEVKITVDTESHADFVDKLQFFTTIPKKGPNGEEDLRLCHRVAQNKFHYYSLICDSAKMEYKFGQSMDQKGVLFCKGTWETLFLGNDADADSQQTQQEPTKTAPVKTAVTAKVTTTVAKTAEPTQETTAQVAKPTASLNVNLTKTSAPTTVAKANVTQTVKPVTAVNTTPSTPASTPGTPQKSNAAAAILAKMNINKTTNT